MHLSRIAGPRGAAVGAIIATAAGLLIALPTAAAATPGTPPPNPSAGQINAAAAHKTALANLVGTLGAQIAEKQNELTQLQGQAELAEQKVALRVSQLRDAQDAAARARAKIKQAARNVTTAHTKFVRYLQASYMDGTQTGSAGTLLTASDPNALLDQTTLEQYQAQNKLDAIGSFQRASVAKSNADAQARAAALKAKSAAAAARQAKQEADDRVAAATSAEAALQSSLASSQTQLDAAQSELATLNHQHAQYVAYQVEQARLRAIARAKARAAAHRRELARIAAAQAAARHRHHHHGGGGGGGSTFVAPSGPSAPSGGSWTAAKGRRAVSRAMSTLGTSYAWAGGGASGPSFGVCDASNGAPNDCYVDGYDCSGLAMYAWGRNWAHYAATQYTQVGRYHPGASHLRPGDLIFWSFNGRVSGIHHVAVYKGGGQIIEAPYSGGFVQVSSLYEYGSFFRATRPLS